MIVSADNPIANHFPVTTRPLGRPYVLLLIVGLLIGLGYAGASHAGDKPARPAKTQDPDVSSLLLIAVQDPRVVKGQQKPKMDKDEFLIYRGTQATLVKTRLVLNAALKQKGVAELELVKKQPDPVAWLEKNLQVDFPNDAAVLRIGLSGKKPDELSVLVNAVTEAYLKEVVNRERNLKQERLNNLKELSTKYEQLLAAKRNALRQLIREAGPIAQEIKKLFAEEQLEQVKRELLDCKSELRKLQWNLANAEARGKVGPDVVVPDAVIEEHLNKDMVIATGARRIQELDNLLARGRGVLSDTDQLVVGYRKEREELEETIRRRRNEMRPHIVKELRGAASEVERFEITTRITELKRLEKVLTEQVNTLADAARQAQGAVADLKELQDEINRLTNLVKGIQQQQEALKAELAAPPRITLLQKAEAPKSK